MQRPLDHHSLGHVEHHSARPACGVQGGELVGAVIDGRKQIRPQPVAVLARSTGPGCRTARPAGPTRDRAAPRPDGYRSRPRCPDSSTPSVRERVAASGLGRSAAAHRQSRTVPAGNRGCRSASILPAFRSGRGNSWNAAQASRRSASEPRRLPAIGQKRFEGLLGKTAGKSVGCVHDGYCGVTVPKAWLQVATRRTRHAAFPSDWPAIPLTTPRFLPSAIRSAGSSRRHIPSAVP